MAFLTDLDLSIFHAVNGWAGHNLVFDKLVAGLTGSDIAKGMIPVSFLWYLWFNRRYEKDRAMLLSTVLVSFVAIITGRLSALLLPFRLRPLHDGGVSTNLAVGFSDAILDGWSSFPSDHAVLYFFLAVALFMVNRLIGLILIAHAVVIIALPRIYVGIHYPSDITAGALIGALIALLLVKPVANHVIPKIRFLEWEQTSPQTFYVAVFFVSFQMASMFNSLRAALSFMKSAVTGVF